MDVNHLLDRAKASTGAVTDGDLAKRLGVKPSAVSNYRHGRALPDAVVCATLAGLTGEPLARVLGIVGEARAVSREEKAVWRKLAATAALLAVALLGSLPAPAQAAASSFEAVPTVHYAKLEGWVRYVGRVLRDWLAHRLQKPKPSPNNVEAFAWI